MCMVPNIPGIPGPPLGGSSSGSNSPSGYSIHSEAKMVSARLVLYFYPFLSVLSIFTLQAEFVHHLTFYCSKLCINPYTQQGYYY